MTRRRVSIEIDDEYLRVVMHRYRVRTESAAVALALRHVAGQPVTRDEALAMRGTRAIAQVPPEVPPLDIT